MASASPLHAVLRRNIHSLLRQSQRQRPHHHHHLHSTKRSHSTTSSSPSRPQAQNTNTTTTTTTTSTNTTTNTSQQQQHHTIPQPQSQIPVPNTVAPPPLAARPTTATTIWQRLGPLTRAGEAYARAQRRRPYLMQTAATLVIYCAGDLVAQYIGMDDGDKSTTTTTTATTTTSSSTSSSSTTTDDDTKTAPPSFLNQYDPLRTLRSMSIGGLAAIPGWHWFLFLSNNFNYPASRALSIFVKVAINQIVFTPLFNTYFFGAHSLLAGATPAEAVERIQRAVPVSMVNSVKLWPAVTAFSFAFIPIEFRSLFAGGIAIGWQAYLSALNKRAAEAAAVLAGSTEKESGPRTAALVRERLLELEEQELVGAARVAAAC